MMLSLLVASALAAPQLGVPHRGGIVVPVSAAAADMAAFEASAVLLGEHDAIEHVHTFSVDATSVDEVSVGQVYRGGWGASPIRCTVTGFVVEATEVGDRTLAGAIGQRQALAQLDCTSQQGVGWLVPVEDPLPYRATLGPTDHLAAPRLEASDAYQAARAAFATEADGREVHEERTVRSFVDGDGTPHRLVSWRWFTGEGDVGCYGEDAVQTYAAVVRDGPAPAVLGVQNLFYDEVRGVWDLDLDGALELQVGARMVGLDGEVKAAGAYDWWHFCAC